MEVFVKPVREALKPVDLVKRGRPLKAVVVSHSVKLPRHVAERQASTASILVERVIGVKPEVVLDVPPPRGTTTLDLGAACSSTLRLNRG